MLYLPPEYMQWKYIVAEKGGFHGWKKVSVKLRMVKRQLQKEFGIQKKKEKSLGRHFATFNWQI